MKKTDTVRYLTNWQNEIDSAAQYHELAKAESNAQIAKIYERLAKEEETHINFWEKQLKKNDVVFPKRKPSWRARTLIFLAKIFGPQFVLSTITSRERADQNVYVHQKETQNTKMTAQEHWHAKLLQEIERLPIKELQGPGLAKLEGRHKFIGGNALRASVLGANDGLCSNLSLVMGVAGAAVQSHTLLITGLAGLLAGSCSMALGEWVSVTSARELAEREISIEEDEYDLHPQGEAEELKLIYEAKGIPPKEAEDLAQHM
ncbi:MAG: VIT1/CCC1 transporter family protein, partial [Bacteriovorax sp.]